MFDPKAGSNQRIGWIATTACLDYVHLIACPHASLNSFDNEYTNIIYYRGLQEFEIQIVKISVIQEMNCENSCDQTLNNEVS